MMGFELDCLNKEYRFLLLIYQHNFVTWQSKSVN